jgi:hypothetical protein
MREATYPAPNPLSIFTTLTFDAQEFIIPSKAANPLNAAVAPQRNASQVPVADYPVERPRKRRQVKPYRALTSI